MQDRGCVAVTIVADGLEGGAVLDTLNGNPDPSAVRALIAGTLLIYNGSTAPGYSWRWRREGVRQRCVAALQYFDVYDALTAFTDAMIGPLCGSCIRGVRWDLHCRFADLWL
jgi:hypothetical protein